MVFVNNNIVAFTKYKKGQVVVVVHDFGLVIRKGMMGEIISASHRRFGPSTSRMSFSQSNKHRSDENRVVVKFKLEEEKAKAVPPVPGHFMVAGRRIMDTLNITSYDELKKIRLADKQERFIYNMNGTYALMEGEDE